MSERIFNLLELELEANEEGPPTHRFRGRSPAHELGAVLTGLGVYEVEPGQATWPYHFELIEEEWLLVVEGTVTVREPGGERTLERGDLVCFPPGPSGAHRIMNRSDSPARTLLFSSARVPAVSVYPDSDKIGIWAGNEADDLIFRRGTAVAWSDGEEGWDTAS